MTAGQILSLAPQTFVDVSALAFVGIAADAGYRHIGVRTIPTNPATSPTDIPCLITSESEARQVADALRSSGIEAREVESVALGSDTRVSDCERGLALAATVGGRFVVAASDDPDAARRCDRIAELGELARSFGMSVVIEFVPWRVIGTLASACDLARGEASDNVAVLIDTLHFDRSGGNPRDIDAHEARLFPYLQLCDAPAARPADHQELFRQAVSDRLDPGEGGLDLIGVLSRLPRSIPISLEVPNTARTARIGAVRHARQVRERTERLLADAAAHGA